MKESKNQKAEFEEKLAAKMYTDPKSFFRYSKSLSTCRENIGQLSNADGCLINNCEMKCELLNEYFSSVFTEDNHVQPSLNRSNICIPPLNVDETKVFDAVSLLKSNSAAGPDGVPSQFIKATAKILTPVLTILFNRCLDESFVPQIWKQAFVTPLFKKGSKTKLENYRPISLTCHLCKIFERLLCQHIGQYLHTYDKFETVQHGFRKGFSTVSNLIDFYDCVFLELDDGIPMDVIYYDLSKAFDKVSHSKLNIKLISEGIVGPIGKWITEWLSDRVQAVVLEGKHSDWRRVSSGVPQGSVLAPLLFTVYIKSFADSLCEKIGKFADDTKTGSKIHSVADRFKMQEGINLAVNWSLDWQIPLNFDKVTLMHFGNSNPWFEYTIDGRPLVPSTHTKDLGVVIDDDLSFARHTEEIVKECNSLMYQLNRTITSRNSKVYLSLFLSLIRPRLEYGLPFWEPLFKKDKIALENIQRKITKKITGLSKLSYGERLRFLSLPSLAWRRQRMGLVYMFKIIRQIDTRLENRFFQLRNIALNNAMETRGSGHRLLVGNAHYNAVRQSFRFRLINLWNSLPDNIVGASSVHLFRLRLDEYVEAQPTLKYFFED